MKNIAKITIIIFFLILLIVISINFTVILSTKNQIIKPESISFEDVDCILGKCLKSEIM